MQDINLKLDAVCLATRLILESGGETYRAEETAEKMCRGFGIHSVDVLALPTGATITIRSEDGSTMTRVARVNKRGINLSRIDECNRVSRKVFRGKFSAEEALKALEKINADKPFSQTVMLIACALSSGFFAIMLGGRWPDFFVALVCGLMTQTVLPFLAKRSVPSVLSSMIVSFLVTFIALLSEAWFPQVLIEPVISGSVMPILPGLAMTNAIRDTIRGDLVSGGARTVDAALCATLLAAGVGIMMSLWGGFIG